MKKLISLIIAVTFTLNSTGLPTIALAKPDALRPMAKANSAGIEEYKVRPFGLSSGTSAEEIKEQVLANKSYGFTNFGRMDNIWMSRIIDGDPDNSESGILKKARKALARSSIPDEHREALGLALSALERREIPVLTFPDALKNREDYCLAFSDEDVIAITSKAVVGETRLDDEFLEILILYLALKPLLETSVDAKRIEQELHRVLIILFSEEKVSKVRGSLKKRYIIPWHRFRVNAERLERVLNEREKVSHARKEDRALLTGGLQHLIDQEPGKREFYLQQYEQIMRPLIEGEYKDRLNNRKPQLANGFYSDELARMIHLRIMVRTAVEISGWAEDEIPQKVSRAWFGKMKLRTTLRDFFAKKIYRMLANAYPGYLFDPNNPSEPHKWHQWEFKHLQVTDGFWNKHFVVVVRHVMENHEGWDPEEIGRNVSFSWLKSVGLIGAYYTCWPIRGEAQGLAAFFDLIYPGEIDKEAFYEQSPARKIATGIGLINRLGNQGHIETAQRLWRKMAPDYARYLKELPPYWIHLAKNAFIMEMFLAAQSNPELKKRWGFKEDFPKRSLAAGSGPSISYSAWFDLREVMKASGLSMPEVMDLDLEDVMLNLGTNPNQKVGDMAELPFDDESFDLYENSSLTHIPREIYFDTLSSAWRILEEDGLIVLTAAKKAFKPSFYLDLKNLGFEVLTEPNQAIRFSRNMMSVFANRYGNEVAGRIDMKLRNRYIIVAKKVKARHLKLVDRSFSIFEDEEEADLEPDIEADLPEVAGEGTTRRRRFRNGFISNLELSKIDVSAVISEGAVIAETTTQEDMDKAIEVIAELKSEGEHATLFNIAKRLGCTVEELHRRLVISYKEFWALGAEQVDLELVREGIESVRQKGPRCSYAEVAREIGSRVKQVRRIVQKSGFSPDDLGFNLRTRNVSTKAKSGSAGIVKSFIIVGIRDGSQGDRLQYEKLPDLADFAVSGKVSALIGSAA